MIRNIVAINEPDNRWWIVYNKSKTIVNYGFTEPNQETTTAMDLDQVFNIQSEWLEVLLKEFGIVPN
jgi:hypothetical protein